ncbi:MAG: hypothetical protein L6Q60_14210 [Rhodocyclaceae bacterium]|nr:hypothetical protein [Rhodocyclaceae bacterium]
MPLSWNEIKNRAMAFSKEWADESSEDAEAKSFWDAFFNVFGITRRRIASFETPVKKGDGKGGYIDLLWRGMLLVEHKSRGKDLDRAEHQAFEYFSGLKERDLPRFVIVSDFARIRLYDLEEGGHHEFALRDLHKHIRRFGFIAGYQTRSFGQEDPVNVQAAEKLGRLHDLLKASGYEGHALEVFLVRLLFCVFAEDTSIFEQRQFTDWIEQRTAEDGSDLGPLLAQLFQTLDTPREKRQRNLDEALAAFPYVNGRLFSERLPLASFDSAMRESLLECGSLNWSRISPAVFGSLFQSIMDEEERRILGAHYTSETNILKALHPLFLDQLWAEFGRIKDTPKALPAFHKKLATLHVFDPACGCGNFLVIAYRELRLLELEVLRAVERGRLTRHLEFDLSSLVQVDVDQFYGIELEEFPSQIAQVALWLTDHQMNLLVSEEFGSYFARLPLRKAPNIANENAMRIDWSGVLPPSECSYVVGNPPFVGKQYQNAGQKADLARAFAGLKGAGVLDYVSCWYRKATEYMAANPAIRTAFVSTNSITQGEQAGVLWNDLFQRGVKIHFAHRTFQWMSEARGRAAVHCVIIGFALHDATNKTLFDYETLQGEPHAIKAANINPYLVEGDDAALPNRRRHFDPDTQPIAFGSMPNDGGHLLLTADERLELIAAEPLAKQWLRPIVGSEEYINGIERWCLWLGGISPAELRAMPNVRRRVEAVRQQRLGSTRETTNRLADTPALFGEIRQPATNYLAVPKTSSERRAYIPIGFLPPSVIANTELFTLEGAGLFHFGVLTSQMHMAWVRAVCGRLKSDYRYSAGIVYNNFPWPDADGKKITAVEKAAQMVLDARAAYPDSTLADLYDPLAMPANLLDAHRAVDKAVDAAYGKKSFSGEAERVSFLFKIYKEHT